MRKIYKNLRDSCKTSREPLRILDHMMAFADTQRIRSSEGTPHEHANRRRAPSGRLRQSRNGQPRRPAVCLPWEAKRNELGDIPGDEELCRKVWEDIDGLAYMHIYQILLSF